MFFQGQFSQNREQAYGKNVQEYIHWFFEYNKIKWNKCFSQSPHRRDLSHNSEVIKI